MGKHLVCPDVSEFQVPLDGTYTRDFVIFRVMFGHRYLDPEFLRNANAAKKLHDQGRIAGALLYVVYTSAPVRAQYEATWKAIGPRIPSWLTGIMIDVETWRGQDYELSGDHSARINQLYGLHAHRFANWNSVIAYGNAGDLRELYPKRDKRCRVIVASYGPDLPYRKIRGAIGQQYTNGQAKHTPPRLSGRRLPRASAPFGPCDHNVFPGLATGRDLVRLLRPEQLHPAPPRKAPVKKAPARKAPAAKPPAKKAPVAKPPAKKAPVAKAPAKKAPAVKVPAKKAPVPPVVKAPPVVPPKPPVPPAPAPPPAVHTVDALVSRNGAHSLVLHDDGTLEVRHRLDTTSISATSISANAITAGEH